MPDMSAAAAIATRARPRAITAQGSAAEIEAQIAAEFAVESGGAAPGLVLVFASDGSLIAPLTGALAARFGPGCRVVGCSSAGEFASGRYDNRGAVAIAFPAAHFEGEAVWLRRLRDHAALDWMATLRAASIRVPDRPGRVRFGILLIDGLSKREELVTATVEATLPGVLVLGGSAGDGLRFGRTHLAIDGETRPESAILCLMSTDYRIEEVVFDHFTPSGQRMVVTEALPEERLILEINAEPAAEEYARMIGLPVADLGPRAFAENPLLVRIGGRHFVRAIVEVTEGGGLRMMSAVDEGVMMTLGRAEDLTDGFEARLARLDGTAALILGFDCILRRIALEQAGLQETVGRIFHDYNIAGFNTYGEQHGGIHVNQTFVGLAFLQGEDGDAAQL